jgi:phosphoserine aminotransferase
VSLPNIKPNNPNFSSGPCAKRPDWSVNNLKNSLLGRSHRASECKDKLKEVITLSKSILNLPKDYLVGIMPASDTGALEAALWCLLGNRGVDILAWENFGKDWVLDIVDELKIKDKNIYLAPYGDLPDLTKVDFSRDVIFTWNGTTSGVKVPNGNWIPDSRGGLTICDATSAVFSMNIDYEKLDVITWSWQKGLGGEAAHGMIALSPRAVERLEKYQPSWPIPKIFRMASKKKFIPSIFNGNTINTPSMLCVEDALDALNWAKNIGGLNSLIDRSNKSFKYIDSWINKTDWIEFLSKDKKTRSNTSITFKINEKWFLEKNEKEQREIMKEIVDLLSTEKVAYDINGYPKAPPSFRIWGGGTVEPENIKKLLPWIDWAYSKVKLKHA